MFGNLSTDLLNKFCCHAFSMLNEPMKNTYTTKVIPYEAQLTPYLVVAASVIVSFSRIVNTRSHVWKPSKHDLLNKC